MQWFDIHPIVVPKCHFINAKTFRQSVVHAVKQLPRSLHLWQFDLDRHCDLDQSGCSETERHRAGRFAARRDGIAFLTSRSLLRHVLSAYSGIPAEQLEFTSLDRRKPAIKGCSLAFNISHSDAQFVIAVGSSGHVGVDIQHVKHVQDVVLARSVFDPSEVAFLEGLPDRDRQTQFFRLWVCREAVLKTVGVGFEGRGLALQRGSAGNYQVFARPTGWDEIGIAEFAGPIGFLGAIAWSRTAVAPQIHHFIVK